MKQHLHLITNNLLFWTPYLSSCAEKIRLKLETIGASFLPANAPGGFRIAAFIDNKVIATSRPGGGPTVKG
jgi:hypothetical protein